jgi:hypothetical protein
MTRSFALFVLAVSFGLTACERHPLPGQGAVTFTHGSGGAHGEHGDGHGAAADHGHAGKHAVEGKHDAAVKHAEKKAEHGVNEEAPKFFPEKK